MAMVSLKVGREGPKWDPYAFDEWHVERGTHKIIGHFGLAIWVSIDSVKFGGPRCTEKGLYRLFEDAVGVTIPVLEKAFQRYHSRCKKCGKTRLIGSRGYPGETLWLCAKCGDVVSCDFDESAVI
jgi:hypothetical protein